MIGLSNNKFILGYRGYKTSFNLNLIKFEDDTFSIDYAKNYPVGDGSQRVQKVYFDQANDLIF